MKCTGKTKAGSDCKHRAIVVVGGLAVCEYHIPQARKLWFSVQDKMSDKIALSALGDERFLQSYYQFKWYRGKIFIGAGA